MCSYSRHKFLLAVAMALAVTCALLDGAAAGQALKHKWDTVSDLMGMHGQGGSSEPPAIEFAATHYGMITTAAPCNMEGTTIEDGTLVRQLLGTLLLTTVRLSAFLGRFG